MDTLELLAGAYASTGRTIDGIRPDQLHAPTPCHDWDVHAVLAHVIGATASLAATARRQPQPTLEGDPVGDDPAAAYAAVTADTYAAWQEPGALDGMVTLPIGVEVPATVAAGISFFDVLVHGWDLAKATGQDATLDPALAEAAIAVTAGLVTDDIRGVVGFGPAVEVAADASPTDRLVAFLGRQP
jgi:uncharacterized protein (TIGR03086 family)